ncbi:MAG: DUF89 family protein, partial [Candidatus Omnitrophica bacterium]|nr:DUF89 family protein [Candidatus Omnitrophota bacterium]
KSRIGVLDRAAKDSGRSFYLRVVDAGGNVSVRDIAGKRMDVTEEELKDGIASGAIVATATLDAEGKISEVKVEENAAVKGSHHRLEQNVTGKKGIFTVSGREDIRQTGSADLSARQLKAPETSTAPYVTSVSPDSYGYIDVGNMGPYCYKGTGLDPRLQQLRDEVVNGAPIQRPEYYVGGRSLNDEEKRIAAGFFTRLEGQFGKPWRGPGAPDINSFILNDYIFWLTDLVMGHYQDGTDPYVTVNGPRVVLGVRYLENLKKIGRDAAGLGTKDAVKMLAKNILYANSFEGTREASSATIETLLVVSDQRDQLADGILAVGADGVMDMFIDNVGPELCANLQLAYYLLSGNIVGNIRIHVKSEPSVVSDVWGGKDDTASPYIRRTLEELKKSSEGSLVMMAEYIEAEIGKKITVQPDEFLLRDADFALAADTLNAAIPGSRCVLFMGDYLYLKLFGNRQWPHTTDTDTIASILRYIKTPVGIIRMIKAPQVMLGAPEGSPHDNSVGMIQFFNARAKAAAGTASSGFEKTAVSRNATYGTICQAGHQERLDPFIEKYYIRLAEKAIDRGMDQLDRDIKEEPMTEQEVIEALSVTGILDKFGTTREKLQDIVKYIRAQGIPGHGKDKVEILFAVPNVQQRGQALWWIKNPDWFDGSKEAEFLCAGGHFNRAGTRIHISLPLIMGETDPAKAAHAIAQHEYQHIKAIKAGNEPGKIDSNKPPAHNNSDDGFAVVSRIAEIDEALRYVRNDLKTMKMTHRYSLPGLAKDLHPSEIFFMNRTVDEIKESGWSASCDEKAYVVCDMLEKKGYKVKIISGAEITTPGFLYKNRGHTMVAVLDVKNPDAGWILVDPEDGRIRTTSWNKDAKTFTAFKLSYRIWYKGDVGMYREMIETERKRSKMLTRALEGIDAPGLLEDNLYKLEFIGDLPERDEEVSRVIARYVSAQNQTLEALSTRYPKYGKLVWNTIRVKVVPDNEEIFRPYFSKGILCVTREMISDKDRLAYLQFQLPQLISEQKQGIVTAEALLSEGGEMATSPLILPDPYGVADNHLLPESGTPGNVILPSSSGVNPTVNGSPKQLIFPNESGNNQGPNATCGTVCRKHQEKLLDEPHIKPFYKKLAIEAAKKGMFGGTRKVKKRDFEKFPMTEAEVIEALAKTGKLDKLAMNEEQLKAIIDNIHKKGGIPEEGAEDGISVLPILPNWDRPSQKLWWIKNPDFGETPEEEEYLYAGGHFNQAKTRMQISLPLICATADPEEAAYRIAMHEFEHIEPTGKDHEDEGMALVRFFSNEEKPPKTGGVTTWNEVLQTSTMTIFAGIFFVLLVKAGREVVRYDLTLLKFVAVLVTGSALLFTAMHALSGLGDILLGTEGLKENGSLAGTMPRREFLRSAWLLTAAAIASETINYISRKNRIIDAMIEKSEQLEYLVELYGNKLLGYDRIRFLSARQMKIECEKRKLKYSKDLNGFAEYDGSKIFVTVPFLPRDDMSFEEFAVEFLSNPRFDKKIRQSSLRVAFHEAFHVITTPKRRPGVNFLGVNLKDQHSGKRFLAEVFGEGNYARIPRSGSHIAKNTPVLAWWDLFDAINRSEAYQNSSVPNEEAIAFILGSLASGGEELEFPEWEQQRFEMETIDQYRSAETFYKMANVFLISLKPRVNKEKLENLIKYYEKELGIKIRVPRSLRIDSRTAVPPGAGINATCGTICESGHEGCVGALDGQLEEFYNSMARAISIERDLKEHPLTNDEVLKALAKTGQFDKLKTDADSLKAVIRHIRNKAKIPDSIEILFAVPKDSHKRWWVKEPLTGGLLYGGGHYNRAGTRIHISLPLILADNDPKAAALAIARHEFAHIKGLGHIEEGLDVVDPNAGEMKRLEQAGIINVIDRQIDMLLSYRPDDERAVIKAEARMDARFSVFRDNFRDALADKYNGVLINNLTRKITVIGLIAAAGAVIADCLTNNGITVISFISLGLYSLTVPFNKVMPYAVSAWLADLEEYKRYAQCNVVNKEIVFSNVQEKGCWDVAAHEMVHWLKAKGLIEQDLDVPVAEMAHSYNGYERGAVKVITALDTGRKVIASGDEPGYNDGSPEAEERLDWLDMGFQSDLSIPVDGPAIYDGLRAYARKFWTDENGNYMFGDDEKETFYHSTLGFALTGLGLKMNEVTNNPRACENFITLSAAGVDPGRAITEIMANDGNFHDKFLIRKEPSGGEGTLGPVPLPGVTDRPGEEVADAGGQKSEKAKQRRIAIIVPKSLEAGYGKELLSGFGELGAKSVTADLLSPGEAESMDDFRERLRRGRYDMAIVNLHGAHNEERPVAFEDYGIKTVILVHRPGEALLRREKGLYDKVSWEKAFGEASAVALLGEARKSEYERYAGKVLAIPHGFSRISPEPVTEKYLDSGVAIGGRTLWSEMRSMRDVAAIVKEVRKIPGGEKAFGYIAGLFLPYIDPKTGLEINEADILRNDPDCVFITPDRIDDAYGKENGFNDLASFKKWLLALSDGGSKVIIVEGGYLQNKEAKAIEEMLIDFSGEMYHEIMDEMRPKDEYAGNLHRAPGTKMAVGFDTGSMRDLENEGLGVVRVPYGADGAIGYVEAARDIVSLIRAPERYYTALKRTWEKARELSISATAKIYLDLVAASPGIGAEQQRKIAITGSTLENIIDPMDIDTGETLGKLIEAVSRENGFDPGDKNVELFTKVFSPASGTMVPGRVEEVFDELTAAFLDMPAMDDKRPCTLGIVVKPGPGENVDMLTIDLGKKWKSLRDRMRRIYEIKRGCKMPEIELVFAVDDGDITGEANRKRLERFATDLEKAGNPAERTFAWVLSDAKRKDGKFFGSIYAENGSGLGDIAYLGGLNGEFVPISWQLPLGYLLMNLIDSKSREETNEEGRITSLVEKIMRSISVMTRMPVDQLDAELGEKLRDRDTDITRLKKLFDGVTVVLDLPDMAPVTGGIDEYRKADDKMRTSA